ncbi:MAG: response regulator [Hespellia sp.]|nr:response regulator [Hespellia sp.]
MKPTVYIVDDEPMAIQYLCTLLEKTNLQAQIVGSASNGVKAIPEIARLHPDFVFVDISMPVMDGLEMSEKVLQNDPMQKIFILTAYKDFEYAQKSIKLGVTDYILKNELSEKMLEDMIRNHMAGLELEKRERHAVMAANLRQFLLSNDTDGNQVLEEHRKTMQRYVFLYLVQKPEIILRHTERQIMHHIDSFEMESTIQEDGIRCRAFVELAANEYCCLLLAEASTGNIKERCRSIAGDIMRRIEADDYQYVCIISEPVIQFLALPSVYERLSQKALCVFSGEKNIYLEEEVIYPRVMEMGSTLAESLSCWYVALESEDADAADAAMKDYLRCLRTQCDIWGYIERIQSLYYFVINKLKEKKLSEEIVDLKNSYQDIGELEQDILRCQTSCFETLRKRSEKNYSRHVLLAQQFIATHYSEDLSVTDVADAVGISEGHLRRCFKKEMDESIINYLTNYRLSLAKKLMQRGKLSIDEIWKQIGFTSGQYFSYVFKKNEGVSPSEYRRENKQK